MKTKVHAGFQHGKAFQCLMWFHLELFIYGIYVLTMFSFIAFELPRNKVLCFEPGW